VVAAGDVIKLIAKVAVAAVKDHIQGQLEPRHTPYPPGFAPEEMPWAIRESFGSGALIII